MKILGELIECKDKSKRVIQRPTLPQAIFAAAPIYRGAYPSNSTGLHDERLRNAHFPVQGRCYMCLLFEEIVKMRRFIEAKPVGYLFNA
jgi:hypothetical protein